MLPHSPQGRSPSLMRRSIEMVVRTDAKGNRIVETDKQHDVVLTPDGGISTHILRHERYYDCGCSTEATRRGGRCVVCGAVSCTDHQQTCCECQAPVCGKHAKALKTGRGEVRVFCHRCAKRFVRSERMKRAGRLGVGLFIEHTDGGLP